MAVAKASNVDVPTNVKEVFGNAEAVFEDNFIADETTGSFRSLKVREYLRACSSQAAVDTETIPHGEIIM